MKLKLISDGYQVGVFNVETGEPVEGVISAELTYDRDNPNHTCLVIKIAYPVAFADDPDARPPLRHVPITLA